MRLIRDAVLKNYKGYNPDGVDEDADYEKGDRLVAVVNESRLDGLLKERSVVHGMFALFFLGMGAITTLF